MIRKASERDAEQIFEILSGLAVDYPFPFGPIWKPEQVTAECRNGGYVDVDAHGTVMAFVLFHDLGDVWEIVFLATRLNARGRGQASEFLRQFLALKPSEKQVWLEVHEGNLPARRLYEKLGFERVGQRPKYYADGGSAVLYNYR